MQWKEEWKSFLDGFKEFLRLEKNLTPNTVTAYITDLQKLIDFLEEEKRDVGPLDLTINDLRDMLVYLGEHNISPRTQGRIVSGLKSFYKYLLIEEKIDKDPTALLVVPKVGRKLPEVLSLQEIDAILNNIDTRKMEGVRNRAMIETLYSCGLRVSELINLRISQCVFAQNYIRVEGKGRKQRLVPIGQKAIGNINDYLRVFRGTITEKISKDAQDILFLSRDGKKLSRVMIFNIIKKAADRAGVFKKISPHTFRHSFATHLLDGGANLRAVQEMLGHESIMTTEIYTHIDANYLRDTINLYHPRSKNKDNEGKNSSELDD